MPKTIDYPRTSYMSAWEVAEVVDDTGGKCAIDTCARKLNRKVSGSFKAIIGSAVKFGLVTSKRELLTTTNLFRRIKHAYDKQEEKVFHREAFLHPPLFTQICRKFRNRELPVHMLDVMLIREFGVEEINAQVVAKSFVEGARMAGIMDERNTVADIDQLAAQQAPRRELASTELPQNLFKTQTTPPEPTATADASNSSAAVTSFVFVPAPTSPPTASIRTHDAVSSLFGLDTESMDDVVEDIGSAPELYNSSQTPLASKETWAPTQPEPLARKAPHASESSTATDSNSKAPTVQEGYFIRISGPGIDTQLAIQDIDDLQIVNILLEKVRKQLSR
ncbi:hypothetical protein [Hymenobacter elongatus]|uniref:Uncharacterized protein n=1 Tax=Hymenobacter elongatus TaxID=877208 RepID=A0A4Z0PRJ1_9BACT|nr:hypothetical protein [Hymenobacter elongatus]TGE18082.1 hypothetical protein E5J99_05990 [Hymenobacter elongatus]